MTWRGHDPRDPGIASETTARVGDVLERAEARAREIREQAERSAAEIRRAARHQAEAVGKDARRSAAVAARARVHRIEELRASIAARAGSLVEGLEGGELTAARLEELVAALGEAAKRILAEVDDAAADEPRRADEPPPTAERGPAAPFPTSESAPAADRPPAPPPASGPLPEGAPLKRKPQRTSARFAAVMMAIEGIERDEAAHRLARDHGLENPAELLDDIFGRADTPA